MIFQRTAGTGMPEAVFFDMDGTLIDSEGKWGEAEAQVVAELGGVWTEADHERNIGGAAVPVAEYILALTGADLPPAQVVDRLYALFEAKLEGGADLRPGAKDLVALVAGSAVPSALVTSTERRLVDLAISGIGLDGFDLSVAGDEVEANKPDPAPYVRAARLLDVDPARCLVFEDSAVGVASALAAGCVTVAVSAQAVAAPHPGLITRDTLEGIDLDWMGRAVRGLRGVP